MLIAIFYHNILVFVYSILFIGFQIVDEFLDVYGVETKFVERISAEEFIFYDRHEC